MTAIVGTRFGPYEILSLLGVGGMGEVYRARDTRLHREVAIKVLPEAFASDPERLARFQREAQLLASLNHPNIAAIYGVEDSGATRALVLELVSGPTLAERIAQGRIPVHEALPMARQIAQALEAAHEQGVVHRDLKPANVKLTPAGQVKVLDFGLAKLSAVEAARASAAGGAGLTNSPTITTPAMTMAGVILGTAAYMSPEQAKGRDADKRSDVWAFGCVLYEMLTARRAFEGDDVSDTMAAILRGTPDWSALPPDVPPAVRSLIRRCLERDVTKRIGDVAAPLFVLDDETALAGVPTASGAPVRRSGSLRLMAVAASALVAGVVIGGGTVWLKVPTPASRVTRTVVPTSGASALAVSGNTVDLAVTPDGSRIIYAGNNGTDVFVRALDQLEPTRIAAAPAGTSNLFVSPDGQWVGFGGVIAAGLYKVPISGGPPTRINFAIDGRARGATWTDDETVIFATDASLTGLQRIPSAGGAVTILTRPDHEHGEADHVWPEALPGGRAVLFTITPATGGIDGAQVAVLDLATGKSKILVHGGAHGRYASSGHLVYSAGSTLRAVAFDLSRLETRGATATVLPHLAATPLGALNFVMSADGTLVYVDGPTGAGAAVRTLTWVDRTGREDPLSAPPRAYLHPRVSPDGTRIAVWADDQESDIWVWELARGTLARATFAAGIENFPIWTPDGRQLIFGSNRNGAVNLFRQAADGTGTAERLIESANIQLASGVSPDGRWALFAENTDKNDFDVRMVRLDGNAGAKREVQSLVHTEFSERNGVVSADGRWLAYESDASGRFEVYVRPFPNAADGQWQVSTAGGSKPLWARNGRELFYVAADGSLTAVTVESNGIGWKAGVPRKVLDPKYFTGGATTLGRTYDVSPDGQRFLMIKRADSDQLVQQIVVVQHWDEELRRLVPGMQ